MPADKLPDLAISLVAPKGRQCHLRATHFADRVVMPDQRFHFMSMGLQQPALVAIDLVFATWLLIVVMAEQHAHGDGLLVTEWEGRWQLNNPPRIRCELGER